MKVYRVRYQDRDEGGVVSWHGNMKSAREALRNANNGTPDGIEPTDISHIDIPTDRIGLLSWLNRNMKRDNG